MPPKRDQPSQGRSESPPDISDTREYSDIVLYFCKSGRFQYHSLQDYGRRQGAISLLKAHRVFELTQDRRLSPVLIQLTAGEIAQRVYLFSLVRRNLQQEELDELIARLNMYLDGMTLKEKEEAVREIIHNTDPRWIPGARNLPFFVYKDTDVVPPRTTVDRDGLPIKKLDDEKIAVTEGKGANAKRDKHYRSLPSKHAIIEDVRTDTERSSNSSNASRESSLQPDKEKDKGSPPKNVPEDVEEPPSGVEDDDQAEEDKREKASRKRKAGDDEEGTAAKAPSTIEPDAEAAPDQSVVSAEIESLTSPPFEPLTEEEQSEQRDTTVLTIRDDDPAGGGQDIVQRLGQAMGQSDTQGDTSFASATGFADVVTVNEFQATMGTITGQMNELKATLQSLVDFQTGKITGQQFVQAQAARGSTVAASVLSGARMPKYISSASNSSEDIHHMVNDIESKLIGVFPINVWTKATNWLLKQDIVQRFLEYRVMAKAYSDIPREKPTWTYVMGVYYDIVISHRLMAHTGKSTAKLSSLSFGRFPLPQVIVDIADNVMIKLHTDRVPGDNDNSTFFKNRNNGLRRTYLTNNNYATGAPTMQLMAQRIYWERMDFYNKHKEIFTNVDPDDVKWTFKKELAGVRKLNTGQCKPDDLSYQEDKEIPADIEDLFFGTTMSKGPVIPTMVEAKELVRNLRRTGLSRPRFPETVWKLINASVKPTRAEIAEVEARVAVKDKKRAAKKKRRREAYKTKHGHSKSEHDDDTDSDEDSDDEAEREDQEDPDSRGPPPPPAPGAGSPSKRRRTEGDDDDRDPGPSKTGGGEKRSHEQSGKDSGSDTGAKKALTAEDLFGSMSSSTSSNDTVAIGTLNKDGQFVFLREVPDNQSSTVPHQILQVPDNEMLEVTHQVVGEVPSEFQINDILAQAANVIDMDDMNVMAATTNAQSQKVSYHVIAEDPNNPGPSSRVQMSGTREMTVDTTATVTRPKSAMAMYEDMEGSDLPEVSSGSSSSISAKFSSESNGNEASGSSNSSNETFGAQALMKKMGPPNTPPWRNKTRDEAHKEKEAKRQAKKSKDSSKRSNN